MNTANNVTYGHILDIINARALQMARLPIPYAIGELLLSSLHRKIMNSIETKVNLDIQMSTERKTSLNAYYMSCWSPLEGPPSNPPGIYSLRKGLMASRLDSLHNQLEGNQNEEEGREKGCTSCEPCCHPSQLFHPTQSQRMRLKAFDGQVRRGSSSLGWTKTSEPARAC